VHQGGGVDHFDHGTEADHAAAGIAEAASREQQQRRANALATAFTQVIGDLRNGGDRGDSIGAKLALDAARSSCSRSNTSFAAAVATVLTQRSPDYWAIRSVGAVIRELHIDAEIPPLSRAMIS